MSNWTSSHAGPVSLRPVRRSSESPGLSAGGPQLIDGFNVAEFWNGYSWRLLDPVGPGGGLADVSYTSPTRCMATGSVPVGLVGQHTLAERWNGSSWRLLATPNP